MSRFLADQPSDRPVFVKRDGAYVIKGSDYDDNIPPWLRISDEYGRGYKEAENNQCKLSETEVRAIRQSQEAHEVLSRRYMIARQTISAIKNGKAYKQVA